MQPITSDASSLRKQAYLSLLKKRLANYARGKYDQGFGGPEAVEEYMVTCHQIKKAKTLGEVLRIAKEMQFELAEAIQLILYPLVDGVEKADLVDAPETW